MNMQSAKSDKKLLRKQVITGIAGTFVGIFIGLSGDAAKGEIVFSKWINLFYPIHETATASTNPAIWVACTLFLVVAIIISGMLTFRFYPRILPIRTLKVQDSISPEKALIHCVSPMPDGIALDEREGVLWVSGLKNGDVRLSGNLAEDAENSSFRGWNWQQILRGLNAHKSCVQYIFIIESTTASKKSEADYKKLLGFYRIPVKSVESVSIDFDDFNALYEKCNDCIEQATSKSGIGESDIVLDVTGGFKTTSIAGAMATLHNRVKFQYVTNSGKVMGYELEINYERDNL